MKFLQVILIVSAMCCIKAVNGVSPSPPTPPEFKCKNGERIQSYLLCDGTPHCADSSDEEFIACHKSNCTGMFRCSYGGCIPYNRTCDGYKDCVDASDENKYLCKVTAKDVEEHRKSLQGQCQDDNFNCETSGECLHISLICDGKKDCDDGTDEGFELCLTRICPLHSYRCAYGGCIQGSAFCNHIPDCLDYSDEMPQICLEGSNETDWRVSHSIKAELKSCRIRNSIGDMRVQNYFFPERSLKVEAKHSTVVRLICGSGYKLLGKDINYCNDGQWASEWPKCRKFCKSEVFHSDVSHTYRCIYNDELIDCKKDILFDDTQVHMGCAPSYKSVRGDKQLGQLLCTDNGNWSIVQPLVCKAQCGIAPSAPYQSFSTPWTVSIFKRISRKSFQFACEGTIVSQHLILTTRFCFPNSELDTTRYAVVKGQDMISFRSSTGYRWHNVAEIKLLSRPGTTINLLALLRLVVPLKFSPNLMPVCLADVQTHTLDLDVKEKANEKLGGSVTILADGLRYLQAIHLNIITNLVSLQKINCFLPAIRQELKDLRPKYN